MRHFVIYMELCQGCQLRYKILRRNPHIIQEKRIKIKKQRLNALIFKWILREYVVFMTVLNAAKRQDHSCHY